jgi:hypothetical protein
LTDTSSVSFPVCLMVSPLHLGPFSFFFFFPSQHLYSATRTTKKMRSLYLQEWRGVATMLHARSTVIVPTPSDIPSLLLCTKNASVWTSTCFPCVRNTALYGYPLTKSARMAVSCMVAGIIYSGKRVKVHGRGVQYRSHERT